MKFKHAFFAIVFVLFWHGVLHLTDGYYYLNQIDVPMHLMGGFAMGILGLAIHHQVSTKHHNKTSPWWYHFAFVVGFAMMVGVAWEFYEFMKDQTIHVWFNLPPSQPSLANTMKDLLNDWIGAMAAFWMFRKKI
jgi:hypothetical protein